MPKGNNYPTLPTDAQLAAIEQALTALEAALAAVPDLGADLRSKTTLSPERLPLADKAIEAAQAAPNLMRRSLDLPRLGGKLAAYRHLNRLHGRLEKAGRKLDNALNVLGADVLFDANNIHEDVEKDNGETVDLGPLRAELHAYYRHFANKGTKGTKGGQATPPAS